VALSPEGIITAGVTGGVTAGVPGAIIGVAGEILRTFGSSGPRVNTFAGTQKESLEIPFWQAMRPFVRDLGKFVLESEQGGGPLSLQLQKAIPLRGQEFVSQIFNRATPSQIREIITSGVPMPDQTTMSGAIVNPVTGITQPPERVDRGRYNEGLENELVSQPQAKALAPSINPVIEIGRYIQAERVRGASVQFRNSVFGPGPVAEATILTIPEKDGKTIYIRSIQLLVAARLTGGTPTFKIRGRAVKEGSTDPVYTHFQYELNDTLIARGDSKVDVILPAFQVPQCLEYIILFELFFRDVAVNINVDASYLPIGVNGYR